VICGRCSEVIDPASRWTGAVSESCIEVGTSGGNCRHAPVGGRLGADCTGAGALGSADAGGVSRWLRRQLLNGQNAMSVYASDEMRSLIEPISEMNW
jgi:hypothetical protein